MNSKGNDLDIEMIIKIGLVVILVVIVGLAIGPRLTKNSKTISGFGDSLIGNQGLTYKNPFYFTAEKINTLETTDTSKCTITKSNIQGETTEIRCKKGDKQNFSITIMNDAEVDATTTYRGAIIVCEYGNKKCCEQAKKFSAVSSRTCTLKPGETLECDAGVYQFDQPVGRYEVHPVAECLLKPEGCYTEGMVVSAKSCNQEKSIIVTVT